MLLLSCWNCQVNRVRMISLLHVSQSIILSLTIFYYCLTLCHKSSVLCSDLTTYMLWQWFRRKHKAFCYFRRSYVRRSYTWLYLYVNLSLRSLLNLWKLSNRWGTHNGFEILWKLPIKKVIILQPLVCFQFSLFIKNI